MLQGRAILILEDEPLLALDLEMIIQDLGGRVIGPASTIAEGVYAAESEAVDAAILDINIRGERSDPVADILKTRAIPFGFATGYGSRGVAEDGRKVLTKPYTPESVKTLLQKILGLTP